MTKKEFMEDLWGAEGDFIDTPLGLMTVALELAFAKIDIGSGIDGFTLFSGEDLFVEDAVI